MVSPRDKITLRRIAKSSWVRPFAFLILIIVLWDLTVRLFKIPPYLIPAPKDVIIAFWTEGDKLLAEAVPTTMATLGGFALSALFGIPMAMLIAGSRTVEATSTPSWSSRSRFRRSRSRRCSWCGSASAWPRR